MSNYVQIANLAATLIGTQARVTDPDDDRVFARTIKGVWDLQRRATIRDGEFNFSVRRAQLPALAGPVPYPFGFAYQMPAEALRLIEVLNSSARDSYKLEGKQILSNTAAPLYIRYNVDVAEPAEWDEAFANSFAARLAWVCGQRIAGSSYDVNKGERTYLDSLATAKSVDARENPPMEQEEVGWVTARYGSRADEWRS